MGNHPKCCALSQERLSLNPLILSSNLPLPFSREPWLIAVLKPLPKLLVKRRIQAHLTHLLFRPQVLWASNSTRMEILDNLVRRLEVHSQKMVLLVPNLTPPKMVSLDRLRRLL